MQNTIIDNYKKMIEYKDLAKQNSTGFITQNKDDLKAFNQSKKQQRKFKKEIFKEIEKMAINQINVNQWEQITR